MKKAIFVFIIIDMYPVPIEELTMIFDIVTLLSIPYIGSDSVRDL